MKGWPLGIGNEVERGPGSITMSEYQMPQQPTGDPDAPEGLEQWISAYYFKLEYVTVELRNNPEKCDIEKLKKALKEEWKKPVADYMYEVSEESKDLTTMAQALCNKRGTTVPELHRIMEMLLVVTDRDWDQFKRGEVKKCLVMKPEDWKPPPRWEGPRFPERI